MVQRGLQSWLSKHAAATTARRDPFVWKCGPTPNIAVLYPVPYVWPVMIYLPLLYVYIYIIIVLVYRLWATNQGSSHLLNSYMIATSFCLSWGLLKVIACFPNWLITLWGVYCCFFFGGGHRKSKPKLHLWIWATANIYSNINSSLGSQFSGPKWNLEGVSLIYCYYCFFHYYPNLHWETES